MPDRSNAISLDDMIARGNLPFPYALDLPKFVILTLFLVGGCGISERRARASEVASATLGKARTQASGDMFSAKTHRGGATGGGGKVCNYCEFFSRSLSRGLYKPARKPPFPKKKRERGRKPFVTTYFLPLYIPPTITGGLFLPSFSTVPNTKLFPLADGHLRERHERGQWLGRKVDARPPPQSQSKCFASIQASNNPIAGCRTISTKQPTLRRSPWHPKCLRNNLSPYIYFNEHTLNRAEEYQ